jgi:cytochrome bd-type quinol oxidase subunit 1
MLWVTAWQGWSQIPTGMAIKNSNITAHAVEKKRVVAACSFAKPGTG